ncbi:hypothetical protein HJG60_010583 [Phyllostomus discolor]|uniref:Secreted protein n=1 Tax=Phyllostomus discolor TaxID=89673 RepID=A0A834EF11_9CHIR|nr:hypothetical protein HJG60_010583 [Phyllostomus discolor]
MHIFFTRPAVCGHLGCVCVLTIVENVETSTEVQVSLQTQTSFPLMHTHTQEWGYRIVWQLRCYFLRNLRTGFHKGWLIYIPTNSARGFPFSTSSPTLAVLRLLITAIQQVCGAGLSLWFSVAFPW